MNLIKCYLTQSTWYKGAARNGRPVGVLWHDTGAGNANIKRYVQPSDDDANKAELLKIIGINAYQNDWNHTSRQAGVNAFIGKIADGSVATVFTGELDIHPWGCGGGAKGSCNGKMNGQYVEPFWFQFEMCDDGYKDKDYFSKVYKEACELTAYICKEYNIDPHGVVEFNGVTVPTILCHSDSYKLGLGGNHGDVYLWFNKMSKTMDDVRNDVAKLLNADNKGGSVSPGESASFNLLDMVAIKSGVTTFYNGKKMASWVPNSKLYVRQINANGTIVVSTLKNGDVTGTVWATDLILVSPALSTVVESPTSSDIAEEKNEPVDSVDATLDAEETPITEEPAVEPEESATNEDLTDDTIDVEDRDDGEASHTTTQEAAQNFAIKLLNAIINFFKKLFNK